MSRPLVTRRALVTGCSSGIGLAIVDALLAQGWAVTGISRSQPPGERPGLTHFAADLLEAAIHAAGILRAGSHEAMDLEEGAMMWRLHVDTAARMIQHLAPTMPDGGRIILIGSRAAGGIAGRSLYAASKAALRGLGRAEPWNVGPDQPDRASSKGLR